MDNQKYFEVFYQPGDEPVFCYRSGLAVYEETFSRGALFSSGWNAAGYPLNVLSNCPTRLDPQSFMEPFAFNLEVNGQSIDYGLTFVDFSVEESENALHAVLTLNSTIAPVQLLIHTKLDGTQMFSRWITLKNLSDQPLNISRMAVLAGGMETLNLAELSAHTDVDQYYSLGYFDNDQWGREGEFAWHDLAPEITEIDCRFARSRYRHPLIFLRSNLMGHIWFAQMAFSGGCRFTADLQAHEDRKQAHLSFKAEITGYNPMLVLRPGEVWDTPEVHMGILQGDLDEAVNEMHDHVRRCVLNLPEADASACMVGCGMGAEHDMSVETSKAFIDQFADMGGEIFIIDAGWQNPPHAEMQWGPYNGINHPNPDRYPNGLSELSDYCHDKGMKFALWVEIERLGKYAEAYEAHPEWRACNLLGEQSTGFIDLTVPEAARWCEEELARIITEYRLDLLRVDYNVATTNYFHMRDTGSGIRECLTLRHFKAVYDMYTRLKKRFPHVLFENCAGGGGRTDLGMMKAFQHTWVSDCQTMPHSIMITNGMTMALPPERVDRLFAGMGCHTVGSFDAHMRNTMLTHMSLNVIAPAAARANPAQMAFIQHSVQLYKDFIRPFLPTARVFHHTPEAVKSLRDGLSILEIAAPDASRGAVAAFTLTNGGNRQLNLCPKGIDPARAYRITFDNTRAAFTVDGYTLSTIGVRLVVPGSMSSELVLYEAI